MGGTWLLGGVSDRCGGACGGGRGHGVRRWTAAPRTRRHRGESRRRCRRRSRSCPAGGPQRSACREPPLQAEAATAGDGLDAADLTVAARDGTAGTSAGAAVVGVLAGEVVPVIERSEEHTSELQSRENLV